ncbi:sensor histidine kinase [Candidatus Uabimicrobium amorphum]|uniref:histidine kinase n=1 Tax=Uabimicrobium amorphum TaxID=2596890 RepID=A0A5S9F471_UABAM|nr:HAMP domain-containing sensor histidine kinase [Candidatus Uabimicrobium amorphum]BBM84279.1 alkaline phosphatase [Candidatus Uabimicrobium amorphum]
MHFIRAIFIFILIVVTTAISILFYMMFSQLPKQKYIIEKNFQEQKNTALLQQEEQWDALLNKTLTKSKQVSVDKIDSGDAQQKPIYFLVKKHTILSPQSVTYTKWQETVLPTRIKTFYELANREEYMSPPNYQGAIHYYKLCLQIAEDAAVQIKICIAICHCLMQNEEYATANTYIKKAIVLSQQNRVNPYLQVLSGYLYVKILDKIAREKYDKELLLFYEKITTTDTLFSRLQQQIYWEKTIRKLLMGTTVATQQKFLRISGDFVQKLQLLRIHDLLKKNLDKWENHKGFLVVDEYIIVYTREGRGVMGFVVSPSFFKGKVQLPHHFSLQLRICQKIIFGEEQIKDLQYLSSTKWNGLTLGICSKKNLQDVIAHEKKFFVFTLLFLAVVIAIGLITAYVFFRKEQQLSQIKSEFVACISHELRTPLAVVQSYAETLQMRDMPKEKVRKYCGVILKETLRLTQLIHNILNLSKIEKGQFFLQKEQVSLYDIANEVVQERQKYWSNFTGTMTMPSTLDFPLCALDRAAIGSVIFNLIDNAVKYQSQKILISVGYDDNSVYLDVEDDGIGIPKAEQRKIFQQFYRSRKDGKGVGIGLALSKKILAAHHGDIYVQSSPQKGATFRITIER